MVCRFPSSGPNMTDSSFPQRKSLPEGSLIADVGNGFESRLVNDMSKVSCNDCRDLVEVPGGSEWKLRCLAESFPQYCWKYAEAHVITQYHCYMAGIKNAPARQSTATLPIFYAKLPNSFSPYDFSIHPKALCRARKRLYQQLQTTYDERNDFVVIRDELCIGAACVVLLNNVDWVRAKILKLTKGNDVIVDLVDVGIDNIVSIQDIRPLLKVFGRLPPLALRCRMQDVDMNDLTAEKVSAFQNLVNSCGNLVRVELTNVSTVPFLVNLYHPTIQGKNLGELFYSHKGRSKRKASGGRRSNAKLAQEVYFVDVVLFILDWLQKPVSSESLYISHVENIRFIYLHSSYHKKAIKELEKKLLIKWSELKIVSEEWLAQGVACAYFSTCSMLAPVRVIVAKVTKEKLWVRSADHGWKKCLWKSDCLSCSLRCLSIEFSEAPLMYLCRLPTSMTYYPHQSETEILRNILQNDSKICIDRHRSKRMPYKVSIFLEDGSFSAARYYKEANFSKAKKHVIHPCFDLVPYKSSIFTQLYKPDSDYQEDLEIFQPFAKGCLGYEVL
ncbi:unnamed protein product [Thelazia callipaeda]|uniref:Tudor domain-containing protein n=1 Tax=Thelazia callipaeda TaxID=103827 RepID=A0A0N5CUF9_THECL|nr:unnamed protein product [Thelazia callipaeda]